ncbi:MAG TPA: glycine cleavage system protein GcvH [Chloroflexota bacterium]|nr:glycine cleavage system protein GcvH [Chloroflexota bacterium]
MNPTTNRYTKEHEWVRLDGDVAVVGITDYAQGELGDVVFVDLPEVGRTLSQGQVFGVVESVKAASDLFAPLSGEVIEINAALADAPDLVNKEPFEGGWMLKVRPSDRNELGKLLDAAGYEAHLKSLH